MQEGGREAEALVRKLRGAQAIAEADPHPPPSHLCGRKQSWRPPALGHSCEVAP